MSMIGLRIEVGLACEMSRPAHPLHLDGLLHDLAGQPEALPIERHVAPNGAWCYKASAFALVDFVSHGSLAVTRKNSPETVSRWIDDDVLVWNRQQSGKLEDSTGKYRQYLEHVPTVLARSAVAYCVGDQDWVTHALAGLRGLGAKRRIGLGVVSSVRLIEDSQAHERWAQRVMPARPQAPAFRVDAVTTPPYYERTRAAAAWIPESLIATAIW